MTSDVAQDVDFVSAFRDAWRRVQRQSEKRLASVSLTLTELRILKSLSVNGPSPMVRFVTEFFLTPPSVTGVIDRLESEGLVERERGSKDRRVVRVRITEKGKVRLDAGLRINKRFVAHVLKSLTSSEAKQLVDLLSKMAESAEDE
jgi:DNA-binding MarR family transcriptional regulator